LRPLSLSDEVSTPFITGSPAWSGQLLFSVQPRRALSPPPVRTLFQGVRFSGPNLLFPNGRDPAQVSGSEEGFAFFLPLIVFKRRTPPDLFFGFFATEPLALTLRWALFSFRPFFNSRSQARGIPANRPFPLYIGKGSPFASCPLLLWLFKSGSPLRGSSGDSPELFPSRKSNRSSFFPAPPGTFLFRAVGCLVKSF